MRMQTRHSVLLLFVARFRFALSVITLECNSLQQLCPNDDQPRMCVCTSNGTTLAWETSLSGGITFGVGEMAGATGSTASSSGGEFSAVLTERANGLSSSTLMFNPSTIRAATGPVTVSCDDVALAGVINTTSITVTSADAPSARQLSIVDTGCGPDNTSYQITLQWNDGDTGGPDVSILYYLVEVTSSPPTGFMCPQGRCNVTTSTTTITGLSCSTEYNFTVTAVNCIGSSSDSETSTITTPTPTITTLHVREPPCFEMDGRIRVLLNGYTSGCYSVTSVNLLYCTNSNFNASLNNDDLLSETMITLPGTGSRDSCDVTVMVMTDCGDSDPVTMTTSGDCSMPLPTTMPTISPSSSPMTDPPSTPLTITKACLIDSSIVNVQWMPPSSASDGLCTTIQSYSLMVSNSTGVLVTMTIVSQTRSVSVSVSISDYYNISLSAISGCGNTTSVTTIVSNACVDPTTSSQVGLIVGIPVTFLLTAIISSLITLLITCLIMRRRESHDKFTPSVVQEPVYDPVSVSGTRPGDAVEMKSNVAYGTTGLGGGANITYETVPQ